MFFDFIRCQRAIVQRDLLDHALQIGKVISASADQNLLAVIWILNWQIADYFRFRITIEVNRDFPILTHHHQMTPTAHRNPRLPRDQLILTVSVEDNQLPHVGMGTTNSKVVTKSALDTIDRSRKDIGGDWPITDWQFISEPEFDTVIVL